MEVKNTALLGSEYCVAGKAIQVGTTESLVFQCSITLFYLPGATRSGSWSFRNSLIRKNGGSGPSLPFYEAPKITKNTNFAQPVVYGTG